MNHHCVYRIPCIYFIMASSRNNHKQSKKGKKKTKSSNDDIAYAALDNNDEELFSVEKIVDSKIDKNGVQLYKCRWKGYTAADDTWEPTENVSSTGVSVFYFFIAINA